MILIKERSGWSPAVLTSYENESELQAILAADGSLVDCSGAATAREFPTASGPIDVLYVDSSGVITIVECKLHGNSDMKRKVVGQLIDYASALARMSFDDFVQRFFQRTGTTLESAVILGAGGDVDLLEWRLQVERSLAQGSFRMVIAVDQITDDLRRSVEYLNSHSVESVVFFALELGYVKRNGVEILVSDRFGDQAEEAGKGPAGAAKTKWTEAEIAKAVASLPDASRALLSGMLAHAKSHGATVKGGVGSDVSAGVYYPVLGKRPSLWSLWIGNNPQISLNIASLRKVSPDLAQRAHSELLISEAVVKVLGTDFDQVSSKYPTLSVGALAEDLSALPSIVAFLSCAVDADPLEFGPIPDEQSDAR